jgi:hypothetical protein
MQNVKVFGYRRIEFINKRKQMGAAVFTGSFFEQALTRNLHNQKSRNKNLSRSY